MKMRRWTSVTGGGSGIVARKIQSEMDWRKFAKAASGTAGSLGDRDAGDQLFRRVEAALHGLGVAMEAVADDRGQDSLHVLGQHLAAALHERPRLRGPQDRHARAGRKALREARGMARVVDDLLHVVEEGVG